jgi:hypothetical protein
VLVQLGFQFPDPRLERCDLLVQQEVFGLDLREHPVHEGTHGRRRGGPIERGNLGRRAKLVHRRNFADHRARVKSDAQPD